MELVTRKAALELGLSCYFTAKPCKHGHLTERYVSNCKCRGCVHDISNLEANRIYYERNRKEVLAHKREYYRGIFIERMLCNSKRRAEMFNREHCITLDYIKSLWTGYCYYTGRKLKLRDGKKSPTIDRIDNTKGYVPGNIAIVCKDVNSMKMQMTLDEFFTQKWKKINRLIVQDELAGLPTVFPEIFKTHYIRTISIH